jgi:LuxR family glucitol operon transcriptional activator
MAEFVATRNTCFALVSAIEEDFRSLIAATAEATHIKDFLPSDVREVAIRRRNSDLRIDSISLIVQDIELLPYIDFADISKVIDLSLAPQLERERDWLRTAAKTLLSLTAARNRVCHTRPLEPEDLPKTLDFAHSLISANAPFYFPTVSNGIARLRSEPGFVLTLQIPTFWGMDSRRTHNNLPIPEFDDTGFLGRSSDRMQVLRLLKSH